MFNVRLVRVAHLALVKSVAKRISSDDQRALGFLMPASVPARCQ
jgi:hypothetical protein